MTTSEPNTFSHNGQRNYSFSGSDFRTLALIRDSSTELKTMVTISFSTIHEKLPVRTLGRNYPIGYTNTISEIKGTMIFNIKNEDPLLELRRLSVSQYEFLDDNKRRSEDNIWLSGEIEPFDLYMFGRTEGDYEKLENAELKGLGKAKAIKLSGIEIIATGKVISVNNVLTEKTYTFVATQYSELYEFEGGGIDNA